MTDPDPFRDALAPRIREVGVRHVARTAKVSAGLVSRWINGHCGITARVFVRILYACGWYVAFDGDRMTIGPMTKGRR